MNGLLPEKLIVYTGRLLTYKKKQKAEMVINEGVSDRRCVRFLRIRSGHGQCLSEASFAGMPAKRRFVKNVHVKLRVATIL